MMEKLSQEYYKIPPTERKATENVVFTYWDLEFFEMDMETLCELVMVIIPPVFIFPRSCNSVQQKDR